MAMISCPTCGKSISSDLANCLYCGRSTKPAPAALAIAPAHTEQALFTAQHVKIVSVDIPLGQLAELLFKLMVAAIPASIVFAILWVLAGAFIVGLLGGKH